MSNNIKDFHEAVNESVQHCGNLQTAAANAIKINSLIGFLIHKGIIDAQEFAEHGMKVIKMMEEED